MKGIHQLEHVLSMPRPDQVYLEGGWVPRVPSVPIDHGAHAVVAFARRTWEANLELQQAAIARDAKLAQAEEALRQLSQQLPLTRLLAVALAAVRAARDL